MTMNPVFIRRSIRKFTPGPISGDQVDLLLKAGLCAPSARNKQPWHLIAVTERNQLDRIPRYHPYGSMLLEASLAILVCGDTSIEEDIGYIALNCSAATENILVTSAYLGLGSVWLGVYPIKDRMQGMKDLFKLPDPIIPVSLIAIGYPAEHKSPKNDYDWNKVRYNQW
ncbi:MAG TPA: nitroreductase family protein [Bacteroidales bacterium]|nr:nitroreductase family protein [Bacteroidales bacterium]